MKISNNCTNLTVDSEGLELKPYLCPAKIPSIGYGSTSYPDGTRVTMQDKPITKARAIEILNYDLIRFEGYVNSYVKVPLTQNQFDALVDFTYNLGPGNLQSSTLLRKLNAGDYAGASAEFPSWVKGGGKVLPGLVTRRAKEQALFNLK